MSLELIRKMRHGGKKPICVHVLIGDVRRGMVNNEITPMVVIKNSDDIQSIDFRPLIGLDISAFECGTVDDNRLLSVLERIEVSNPRNISLALKTGVCGFDKKHENILRSLWRSYQ